MKIKYGIAVPSKCSVTFVYYTRHGVVKRQLVEYLLSPPPPEHGASHKA